ncbi:MAG: diguanylate cyclase [Chromatiaceae bacterium]|nr:diguanylate cyclase [Chromatiaceae bacterium]
MLAGLQRLIPRPRVPEQRARGQFAARQAIIGFVTGVALSLLCIGLVLGPFAESFPVSSGPLDQRLVWLLFILALALLSFALLLRMRGTAQVETAEILGADDILRALLGTTRDGVLLVDPERRIRLFNPAAEILFGRLSDETLSIPVQDLIPTLETAEALGPAIGRDAAVPQVCHLDGRRAGDEFPLRLLVRAMSLSGRTWHLILAEDLTESERSAAQVDFLERHDPLTGLGNRRAYERAVVMSALDPDRARTPHALCLLDLDHFKIVNSTCGHAAGDKLLQQVARIVSTRLGQAEILARLGADEFAALFVGEAAADAETQCEELVRALRSFLFTWQERSYDVSGSMGLVSFIPADGVGDVLARADVACQSAKAQGRGRLQRYSSKDAASISRERELTMISNIGGALDDGRFRIFAQPILPLRAPDSPMHFEVLVRMRDDQGNPVAPDHFIPAAERYILMPMVDRWILSHLLGRQAEQLRAWHERHPDSFLFAVNLSATTLMDEGFLPFLKRQFEDNRVPYASICFEVTETTAIADFGRARSFMHALGDLGSSFAVDDFGAGFASYTYLKSLPLKYLKIDGSFVRHLETDAVDRALVESINRMGHVLGLETIAEWAETPDLVEALRGIGVDYAQGYGVGEPVALESLPAHRAIGHA